METRRSPWPPPRWVIRVTWAAHRALYSLSGGRRRPNGFAARRSRETAVVVFEPGADGV